MHHHWKRVDVRGPDDCWPWTGPVNNGGYPTMGYGGKVETGQRFALLSHGVSIPPGKVVDHLCRNRRCMNPRHLEIVDNAENLRRGNGFTGRRFRQTHCIHGHPLSGSNLCIRKNGTRRCRTCQLIRDRDRMRRRAKGLTACPDCGERFRGRRGVVVHQARGRCTGRLAPEGAS